MSFAVTVMLAVQLIGEEGLFELAILAAGAVLGVLLGRVPRLGCSLGMGSDKHRVNPGYRAMVMRTPTTLAVFAYGCLEEVGAGRTVSATALTWKRSDPCASCRHQARYVVESEKHPSPMSL